MRAIDVGWVAAPTTAATILSPMSEVASQAHAVARAATVAAAEPIRKMRRCPCRSPSLPSSGRATADSRTGAEMTQAMVVSRTLNSDAIEVSEMVRMVIGKLVAKTPVRAAMSTQVGYVPRASRRATTARAQLGRSGFFPSLAAGLWVR